jgi:hypothetical protein
MQSRQSLQRPSNGPQFSSLPLVRSGGMHHLTTLDDSLQKYGIYSADGLSPFALRTAMDDDPQDPLTELRRNLLQMQQKRQEVSLCRKPQPIDSAPSVHASTPDLCSRGAESPTAALPKKERSFSVFSVQPRPSHIAENLTNRDEGGSTARSTRLPAMMTGRPSARPVDELESSMTGLSESVRRRFATGRSSRLSTTGSDDDFTVRTAGSYPHTNPQQYQRSMPPRTLVDGRCVTPFYHCSSGEHTSQITKIIESGCSKVDESFSNGNDQKKSGDATDYAQLGQLVMRTLRPAWQMTKKKYQTNGKITFMYKMHIRNFWKFVIGRVLSEIHIVRISMVKAARKGLAELRKAREAEAAKVLAQKRAKLAEQLFSELVSLRSNRKTAAQLTQPLYLSLKTRFLELAAEGTEVINLREFVGHARVDANLLRKLDRDQSGTLEFGEVLKTTFPSVLQKDLQALSRKWDVMYRDSETQQESAMSLLSAESKAMAMAMFRLCDVAGKGVISREDMMRHFVPADWDPNEPLWFERHFQTPSAVASFEEFVEMIKFCFPPFRHGANASGLNKIEAAKADPVKPWRLPSEVIEAQERATACD